MQLNVLDDLAEAMKALDGKKVSTTTVELRSHLRACIKLPTFGLDLAALTLGYLRNLLSGNMI